MNQPSFPAVQKTESTLYTLMQLNRTEAVKSVLLSLLLQYPGASEHFVDEVLHLHGCRMRSAVGQVFPLNIKGSDTGVHVSPLFHTWRDMKKVGIANPSKVRNEVDIVVAWPNRLVLGMELKWQSSTAKLTEQLASEQECLRVLAGYYNAPCTSLVAVLPRPGSDLLQHADGVIPIPKVADFAKRMAARYPGEILLGVIAAELSHMASSHVQWKTYRFQEVLDYQPIGESRYPFVGYMQGCSHLKQQPLDFLRARPWKIIETDSSKPASARWIALSTARDIFRQKMQISPAAPA